MGSGTKQTPIPKHLPSTSSDSEDQNPSPTPVELESGGIPPFTLEGTEEDAILSKSDYLTREEVIKRRFRRLKLEIQVYEDYYWALMEDYRVKHREYYWNYGKSPFREEEAEEEHGGGGGGGGENGNVAVEQSEEMEANHAANGNLGLDADNGNGVVVVGGGRSQRCAFNGCKAKAMALTRYCHPHILLDTRQRLYKACSYIVKSQNSGPVHCDKPILRSTVPALCSVHFGKAQTHLTRALKRAGLNISSTSKLTPKLHHLVAESVKQINTKRREKKKNVANGVVKTGNTDLGNGVAKEENTSAANDVAKEENSSVGSDVVMEENINVGNDVIQQEENAG